MVTGVNIFMPVSSSLTKQDARIRETLAGRLPDTLAAEGVQLQYAVDARLDELLTIVFTAATAPPLLGNPFCRVLDAVRRQAANTELWKASCGILQAQITNDITRVGPCDSFVYAGARKSSQRDRTHLVDLLCYSSVIIAWNHPLNSLHASDVQAGPVKLASFHGKLRQHIINSRHCGLICAPESWKRQWCMAHIRPCSMLMQSCCSGSPNQSRTSCAGFQSRLYDPTHQ